MRESLDLVFSDPVENFSIPAVVRKHSAELAGKAKELEARLRKISASSEEAAITSERASKYVEERDAFTTDAAMFIKESRAMVSELREKGVIDGPTSKRAREELETSDIALLQERSALAANRVKLQYGILSHTTNARIGEAYLASIVKSLPHPAEATVKKQGSRDNHDQASFRVRLSKEYSPETTTGDDESGLWCPITKSMHRPRDVKAAQLVPYAIGEVNAAYLFGLDPDKGYEAVWSTANGLLLYDEIEEAFDAARLVIIPDGEYQDELKVVVLDEAILNREIRGTGLLFRDIDGHRLEFKTDARPGRRYLYLHTLLSLFRRKRVVVEGWQRDFKKVGPGQVWGTPGQWLRRSIVKALAYEIGDISGLEDVLEDQVGLADFADQVSEEKEARRAVSIRQAVEGLWASDEEG